MKEKEHTLIQYRPPGGLYGKEFWASVIRSAYGLVYRSYELFYLPESKPSSFIHPKCGVLVFHPCAVALRSAALKYNLRNQRPFSRIRFPCWIWNFAFLWFCDRLPAFLRTCWIGFGFRYWIRIRFKCKASKSPQNGPTTVNFGTC